MSNLVRFDPLLVRALAAELHARLAGRLAHPFPVFDRDLSAVLPLDRGESLRLDLHPSRGWLRIVPAEEEPPARPEARVVRVHAPDDERLLRIELHEGNRFRGGSRILVVELQTNQWNALLVDGKDGRIHTVLRTRESGGRSLRTGAVYEPPSQPPRVGPATASEGAARAEWDALLAPLRPAERAKALVRRFAWTSPLNARALLGAAADADDPVAMEVAFDRWWTLGAAPPSPVLLETSSGPQPYPVPLPDLPARPLPSLLAAFEEAAASASVEEVRIGPDPALVQRVRRRLDGARRRVARLRDEAADVGEAERIRARGDLLLSSLHLVPAGAESVRLTGFDGEAVDVPLDPSLRPSDNAQRLYEEARKRSRAEERIPALLADAEAEAGLWQKALEAAERGEMDEETEEVLSRGGGGAGGGGAAAVPRRPYRTYRTSGGLEVRVGRGSADNDRLTFGHSAPEDVWLHARQVPGSHVVLRWRDPGAAPPARDLEEAAVLAALYSKARTSGTVAVDWTRRKHVRKPRNAPPGKVVILRGKTLFVEPDPAVEERLRPDSGPRETPGPSPSAPSQP